MDRIRRLYRVLRLRGPGYPFYLVIGYLVPRWVNSLVFESRGAQVYRRLLCKLARRFPARAGKPPATAAAAGPPAGEWLPEATLKAAATRRDERPAEPAVLGRLDNDGRLLALCGPVPGLDEVEPESFVPRYRYRLELVVASDQVQIRKDFRGDRRAFERERRSLSALAGLAGVPAVQSADAAHTVLVKSFVPGPTLRQCLVAAGARILSVDTEVDVELAELDPAARIEAVWGRGRERFPEALPEGFLAALEQRLDAIHRRGVTGFSLSFGNVVLDRDRSEPWFIDFDAAETHRRPRGLRFASCRDRDRDLFNRIYGRSLLTERSARALIREIATPYAPFDLGRGLASRGFWSVDSGTGRWQAVNRRALDGIIQGRRILDLGSYNGLLPLLMLAGGARRVVAVERSPEMIARAAQLHRLFEWRDLESYDLELHQADMRAIFDHDWGPVDVVTAFCSLYYLDEADMGRVVRRASELAPVMILQAKTDTDPSAADNKAEKSSLAFLQSLLEEHGFPAVSTVAPAGFSRPILIGRRDQAS